MKPTPNDTSVNAQFFTAHPRNQGTVDAIITTATAHGLCVTRSSPHVHPVGRKPHRGDGIARYLVLRPGFTRAMIPSVRHARGAPDLTPYRPKHYLAHWDAKWIRNFQPGVNAERECLEAMYAYVSTHAICTACGNVIDLGNLATHAPGCAFGLERLPPLPMTSEQQQVNALFLRALEGAVPLTDDVTPMDDEPAPASVPALVEDDWDSLFPED